MGTKLGTVKVKILKSGRHIHVQNFLKYPPGFSQIQDAFSRTTEPIQLLFALISMHFLY